MKLLPVVIMLLAGACTSIITWVIGYESKTAVWILCGVLVLFYIIGLIVQKIIWKFEEQVAEAEAKLAEEEEGKVVEKEGAADAAKRGNMNQADADDTNRGEEAPEATEE